MEEMHGAAAVSSASSSDSEDVFFTPDALSEAEEGYLGTSPIQEDEAQDGEIQDDAAVIHARAYQVEMFEESLRRNIIVAVRRNSTVARRQTHTDEFVADGYGHWEDTGVSCFSSFVLTHDP